MKKALSLGRILTPRVVQKALQTFDRSMLAVVAGAWGVSILLLLFALFTVGSSVKEKGVLVTAMASEPVVPVTVKKVPELKDLNILTDRLQKRFPDINFQLANDKSLTVMCVDGNKFRLWLTVLSYIDTMSPQIRWSIRELCVGNKCSGNAPMKATLSAEKITFSLPVESK